MSKKQYGTYAIAAFDRDTAKEKKLEILKDVIPKLIDNIGKCEEFEPDLNTLQLIIKEEYIWQSDDLTWYEHEEKGPEPGLPFWGMTIGIKIYEREATDED